VTYGSGDDEVNEYVNQIERLLNSPPTYLLCREIAERYFNLDSAIKDLLNIYNGLLDQTD
jgi:hypothetical protein